MKTPLEFVRLWLHEAGRVYGDKLIEDKDLELLQKMRLTVAKSAFDVRDCCIQYLIIGLRETSQCLQSHNTTFEGEVDVV